MYSRYTQLLFLQALLILSMATFYPRSTEAGFLIRKAHVTVINDLKPGLTLKAHCLSEDDDLGVKVLAHGGNFSFVFRPNFQGTTLFHCGFVWPGLEEANYFNIFDGERDHHKCQCSVYNWSIREDGPVMFNWKTASYNYTYKWNTD